MIIYCLPRDIERVHADLIRLQSDGGFARDQRPRSLASGGPQHIEVVAMHEWNLLVRVVRHLILDVDLGLLSVLRRRERRLCVGVSLLRRNWLVRIVLKIRVPWRQHWVVRDDVYTAFWPQLSLWRGHDVVILCNSSTCLK